MTNSRTVDRRDVAHPTNPVGGQEHIEQINKPNLADPIDLGAARLSAVDQMRAEAPGAGRMGRPRPE